MKYSVRTAIAALACLAAVSGAAVADKHAKDTVPARAEGLLITMKATVEAVDQSARLVTLKREDGQTVVVEAGPEVRNLAQVEVGDIVEVDYFEVLVTMLEPVATGVRERVERVEAERADPGQKPAASVTRTVEIIASVMELDREGRMAVLRGAENTMTVKVDDDVNLDLVKVGDDVRAVYQETIAITVREP